MDYKKFIRLGVISIVLLLLKIIVTRFALLHPALVEKYYSRGIYPLISKILTSIANIFPFSLGEFIVAAGIIGILVFFVRLFVFLWCKRFKEIPILIVTLLLSIMVALCFFDGAWLLNNYRPDFEDLAHFSVEKPKKEDLANTFRALVLEANTLRAGLSENEEHIPNELTLKQVLNNAYLGYETLSKTYDFFRDDRVRVKGLISSPFQTSSGYTGVYLFFIGEPTINKNAPIFTIPHTASHEIAHQQGFAQEEDANYIGFLACKNHPSTFFQYSGYLAAVSYVSNALYLVDADLYYEMAKLFSPEVLGDLRYDQNFWEIHKKKAPSKVVNRLNDSYLKSYNQEEGIKSYGKFVDLLIADFIDDNSI